MAILDNLDNRLFVYDQKYWKKVMSKDYCIYSAPKVIEVEDGVVLPMIKRTDISTRNAAFKGGICDNSGTFVAGLNRKVGKPTANLSCTVAYEIPNDLQHRHETVVIGGVLYGAFSHLITESLSRLWWFADNPETPYKFIFLDSPAFGGFKHYGILEAIGLPKDRFEIIRTPTRFDKIIVPEEAYHMLSGYRPGAEKIYAFASSRIEAGPYKKVYLSRSMLKADELTYNEQYFEDFYRKRGFEIIYPEQIPFSEQISIVAGANEIVASEGGLIYLSQFCRPNTRVTILRRAFEPHFSTFLAVQMKIRNCYLVDAYFNFLPATLPGDSSVYFMGPTICWRDYLDKTGICYETEETSVEQYVKPYIYDYLVEWGNKAAQLSTYKDYRNTSLIDIVENVNLMFCGTRIKRKAYPDRDDIVKLRNENIALKGETATLKGIFQSALTEQIKNRPEELQKVVQDSGIDNIVLVDDRQVNQLKKRVAQLEEQLHDRERSLSWRITKPLRILKAWIKRLFKKEE